MQAIGPPETIAWRAIALRYGVVIVYKYWHVEFGFRG